MKSFEPGLTGSLIVGIGVMSGNTIVALLMTFLACFMMLFLFLETNLHLPSVLQQPWEYAQKRFGIFPFEMYLIVGWILVTILYLCHLIVAAHILVCLIIFLAGFIAVQANIFHRESKVTSTEVSLGDFSLFWSILVDPTAPLERKNNEPKINDSIDAEHFRSAEEEKMQKELMSAENLEEHERARMQCQNERKMWEIDIEKRYNDWLIEEYARLKAEKSVD